MPAARSAARNEISGVVSLPWIRLISQLRRFFVNLSVMVEPAEMLAQARPWGPAWGAPTISPTLRAA